MGTLDVSQLTDVTTGNSLISSYVIRGVCSTWLNYDQSTPSVIDELNVSSMDDDGTGDWGCNFTTSYENSNYLVLACPLRDDPNRGGYHIGYDRQASIHGTSSFDGASMTASSASADAAATDTVDIFSAVVGALA